MVFIVGLLLVLLSMVEFSINVAEMKEMFDVLLFVAFSAWSCLAGAGARRRQIGRAINQGQYWDFVCLGSSCRLWIKFILEKIIFLKPQQQ